MGPLRFFARHGTAANLLLIVLVVAGFFAGSNIRTQTLPDVVTEAVDVTIRWPDATAQSVDRAIVSAVTPTLQSIEGVAGLYSSARAGRAFFEVTFEPGWNMDRALADVSAALPPLSALPDGAEAPKVRFDRWRDRVLDVVLSADLSRAQLEGLGEELAAALRREGVTRVSLRGQTAPEIAVTVSPEALALHDLTFSEVVSAIEGGAREGGAGQLIGDASRLITGDAPETADAIRSIRVPTAARSVAVGELASVETVEAGTGRAYFLGARPAVSLAIDRGADGDALLIAESVDRALDAFLETAPEGVEATLLRDRAAEIEDRIGLLVDNAALGLVLVLALLFLFLSPAAALWVAAGIPVAVAAGLALMWVTGQTLNMVSIYALILCLGIIVDDAIVVAEHAEYRHGALGEARGRAAERAARRMLGPVLASTLTTVVAFLSLYSIGGDFGAIVATIPFVVAVILIASLAECFLILPHHMAAGAGWLNRSVLGLPSRVVGRGLSWVRERVFRPFIGLVISVRYAVLLLVVAASAQALLMVTERDVRWQFFVSPPSNTVTANFAMAEGATRNDTVGMLREVERAVAQVNAEFEDKHGVAPILTTLGEVGGNAGRGLAIAPDKDPELLGSVTLELIDSDVRSYGSREFITALEAALREPATLEAFSFRSARRGPGGDSLDVILNRAAQEDLAAAARDLKATLSAYPEITGVEDTLVASSLDRRLTLSAYGEDLGFELDRVAAELRERSQGATAFEFVSGLEQGRVTVSLPPDQAAADLFERWRLIAEDGTPALLSEIVDVDAVGSPRSLYRTEGQLIVRVSGEIDPANAARADDLSRALVEDILPQLTLAHGVSSRLAGLAEEEAEFISDATVGYALCLLAIYGVLALVLGSWFRPFAIMAVIPAGLIGVVWGHALWGSPINVFSVVGFIGLSGIVVNDSIVLVTTITEKLKDRAAIPATIDATCERLRPVLLTTLTTVLGLLPLLFETSRQAEFLKPMILTLVSGLSVGFFLVLLIVPALFIVGHDLSRMTASARRAWTRATRGGRRQPA